jgi:hypothetical protein
VPERCGHCGYDGDLREVARPVVKEQTANAEGYGPLEVLTYWFLYRCPRCEKATLVEDWWCDEISDPEDDTSTQLFPTPQDNSAVPQRVAKSYWEANRIKGESPSLYAVGIRRTVEAVCKHQGASSGSLEAMLNRLADEGRLPRQLADMGHQLRARGNLGAHVDDVEVTEEDIPVIEEFADAILEYIYRAPAKIAAAQASLDAREAESGSEGS